MHGNAEFVARQDGKTMFLPSDHLGVQISCCNRDLHHAVHASHAANKQECEQRASPHCPKMSKVCVLKLVATSVRWATRTALGPVCLGNARRWKRCGPGAAQGPPAMQGHSRQMTSVAKPPVVAGNIRKHSIWPYKMQHQKRSMMDKSDVKYTSFLPLDGVYESVLPHEMKVYSTLFVSQQ